MATVSLHLLVRHESSTTSWHNAGMFVVADTHGERGGGGGFEASPLTFSTIVCHMIHAIVVSVSVSPVLPPNTKVVRQICVGFYVQA